MKKRERKLNTKKIAATKSSIIECKFVGTRSLRGNS